MKKFFSGFNFLLELANSLWFLCILLTGASVVLGITKSPWFFLGLFVTGGGALWYLLKTEMIETMHSRK
jgi:hypothetical protein